jgi:O-antigen/teichoic acid export membrane protein
MFIGIAADLGINYASKIAIARFLGADNFGLVTLGNTVLTFVSIFVILGLDTGISRFLPRYDDRENIRGILVSGFQIGLGLGILTGALLVIFASPIATMILRIPEAATVIRIFGVTVPIFVIFKLAMGGIRGTERSLPRVYAQHIGMPLMRLGLFLVAMFFGGGVLSFALGYSLAYGFGAMLGVYFLRKHTPILNLSLPYAPMYKELLTFSTPLIISAIMYRVLSYGDIFLLSYFTGSSTTVGIYSVIYSLSRLMLIVLSAFGYITLPVLSRLESDDMDDSGRGMQEVYGTLTKWVFIMTFPLFLTILQFPRAVIDISFGSEYVAGAVALQILAAGFFSHAIFGPNGSVLQSVGKTRIIMIDNVAIAAFNLALNAVSIPLLGLVGASLATAVSYVVLNVIYSYQLYKATKIQPISGIMFVIAICCTPAFFLLAGAVGLILNQLVVQLVATTLVFGIGYLFLLPLIAIGERELNILNAAVKKYPPLKPMFSLVARLSRL